MVSKQFEATSGASRGGSRKRTRPSLRWTAILAAGAVLILAVPVALAAGNPPIVPGQKIDMKVLLVSADGTETDFGAWKKQLEREGVPYDTFTAYDGQTKAATLTDARLADYTQNHAKYQAVILSTGDLGHPVTADGSFVSALTDAEWETLAKFERTFAIRQLSNNTYPTAAHGLTLVPSDGSQDGKVGRLTATGAAAFPYLNGPIPIADDAPAPKTDAFGYEGTPVNAANWETLVAGPNAAQPTAYLGVYHHPEDGREEMVMTVASNELQSHNQLLRHGMLNWVTRGVFLGYQRNYLELQIDDVFLPDDVWDPTTHTTDYDPAHAVRMSAADADAAVKWSHDNRLRLDMAYNGFGADALLATDASPATDELLTALKANRATFGWVNHTYSHPNLDCSTQAFIADEITRNAQWAQTQGFAIDPGELVTGEHSGLANTRPGNPGTIDPPAFNPARPTTAMEGKLPPESYVYAVTATSTRGETLASVTAPVVVAGAENAVDLSWNAVCHATSYKVYRAASTAGPWALVKTLPELVLTTDTGVDLPRDVAFQDNGAAVESAELPIANTATLDPYVQNTSFVQALKTAGVKVAAGDASKTYPNPPASSDVTTGPMYSAGTAFTDGPAVVVPRYPTNVYYNTATLAQQIDEFNWLYNPAKGCTTPRTDCLTGELSPEQYVAGEDHVMFRHITDNDPRPHYFHQTNLALTTTPGGGIFYQVIDPLLATYRQYFADNEPLLQLTPTQIGETLGRQSTWATKLASGKLTAWLEDGRIHVSNGDTTATEVPLTGTTVGSAYGGQRSGWTTIAAGSELALSPDDPAAAVAPPVSGSPIVGERLSAGTGTWAGTPTIAYAYQWQRCNAHAAGCTNVPAATAQTYALTAADLNARLRVVVSAGNWTSSVSQAASSATVVVANPQPLPAPGRPAGDQPPSQGHPAGDQPPSQGQPGAGPPLTSGALALTKVKMSPRRFAVSHPHRRRASRLDGSTITWNLNKAATVRLSFQRKAGKHRWVTMGTITRRATTGSGVVRFTGRLGRRLLAPQGYRLVATASAGRQKSGARRVTFRVLRG